MKFHKNHEISWNFIKFTDFCVSGAPRGSRRGPEAPPFRLPPPGSWILRKGNGSGSLLPARLQGCWSGQGSKGSCAGQGSKDSCAGQGPKGSCPGQGSIGSCSGQGSRDKCAGQRSTKIGFKMVSRERRNASVSSRVFKAFLRPKSVCRPLLKKLCKMVRNHFVRPIF